MTGDPLARIRTALDRLAALPPDRRPANPWSRWLGRDGLVEAAVLVGFVPDPTGRGPSLLLTERSRDLSHHKGQISFPGGKIDPGDAGPRAAALREAHEEIGLDPDAVQIVGALDRIPTVGSSFVITPVIAVIAADAPLRPNPGEVERIIPMPLSAFTDPANEREKLYEVEGEQVAVPFFDVGSDVVWGATARIIRTLIETVDAFAE